MAINGYVAASLVVGTMILALLASILVTAFPALRRSSHNFFESTHRFGGWSVLALFWILIVMVMLDECVQTQTNFGLILVQSPLFWIHLVTTMLTAYPWFRTKLNTIETEPLSRHAIRVHFSTCRTSVIGGGSVRISHGFLSEYHSFAVIPATQSNNDDDRHNDRSFSIIVSNAGDWTKQLVNNPPRQLYLRQLPALGAVSVARLFSPVVIVATGSGIGPCLGMFVQYPRHSFKVIWVAREPHKRYGSAIVSAVHETDPDVIMHDTSKDGRIDSMQIVELAKRRYHCTRAEAVVVISNKPVIDTMVFELSKVKIPCYGPIFDS